MRHERVAPPDHHKTIAVTGGSGFIGRHLVEHLVARGHKVRVLVRSGKMMAGGLLPPIIQRHVYGGVFDMEGLERGLLGADVVVHLAARVHVMREMVEDPLRAFRRVNVDGTDSVISAARRCGVQHLVFLSSVKAIAESSSPTEPLNRFSEAVPSDPYGISKLEAERLLEQSARDGAIAVTVLRPPLVYGPGVRGNMLRLFRLVHRGFPLPFAGVDNLRSQLYVGNLIFAIESVAESRVRRFRSFFVSDTSDLSTPEFLRLIGEALNRPARLLTVPEAFLGLGGRMGDLINRIRPFPLSSEALRRLTGSLVVDSTDLWTELAASPPFTPRQGIMETGRWFRKMVTRADGQ